MLEKIDCNLQERKYDAEKKDKKDKKLQNSSKLQGNEDLAQQKILAHRTAHRTAHPLIFLIFF